MSLHPGLLPAFTAGMPTYIINFDTCIVTGYRPFGNIRPTYALNDVFNRTAQKADTPEKSKDILNAYVKEVLSNV